MPRKIKPVNRHSQNAKRRKFHMQQAVEEAFKEWIEKYEGKRVRPYMMKYNKRMDDRFLNALARYVDRGPAAYRSHGFDDYCERRAPDLVDEVRGIIDRSERDDVPLDVPYNMPAMQTLYPS